MYKKLLFSLFLFSFATLFAQDWNKTKQETTDDVVFVKSHMPSQFQLYAVDLEQIKEQLQYVEMKGEVKVQNSTTILNFPNENGKMEAYKMLEWSVFEPALAEKFPMIKTYIGQSVKNSNTSLTMSIGTDGLHVMYMRAGKSTLYVDPYTRDRSKYILYTKNNLPSVTGEFECDFSNADSLELVAEKEAAQRPQDGVLRTYRLAVACTVEYSQYHLTNQGVSSTASLTVKKAAVLSAITNTISRVAGVYRLELGVTFNLVANEEDIIYIDSDNFTNDNAFSLIDESHDTITSVIGTANFDVGHTFSTGGGGLAQRGSICYSNAKGRGITGSNQPIGDSYDIDYVSHEMGHQFGANHTFNAETGSCGGGNRNLSTAGEPGSGSTIMAYAGICSPNDVQAHSDAYFNYFSINEINTRITSSVDPQCAAITTTGNIEPTADAGADVTIPKGTPFILEGISNDASTPLYCWEQIDTQDTDYPLVSTATAGPAYRTFFPTENPKRYMPKFPTVVGGSLQSTWEVTPTVGRTLHFALTTRDYDPDGGQTNSDLKTVTVSSTIGPFTVSSQTTLETWSTGESKTVTWDVAGSDSLASNVKIAIVDMDGTELAVLVASTPNDGSQSVTVPSLVDDSVRIMVSAVGNIFYAINSGMLAINSEASCDNICESYGATGGNDTDDGTTLVLFNTINNSSSGVSAYTDYTAISTSVNRGQSYDLTVNVNTAGSFKEVTKVWIDWNRDCSFNTTDEEYTLGEAVNVSDGATSLSPLNITVPAGASLGSTTMRVSSAYTNSDTYPTSCGALPQGYGEVEDYTIVITDNNAATNNVDNFSNFVLSPNPNNGNFNIRLQSENTQVKIAVYDLFGRQVFSKQYENNQLEFNQNINLNTVQAGMYIVHVSDGNKSTTEKVIIK